MRTSGRVEWCGELVEAFVSRFQLCLQLREVLEPVNHSTEDVPGKLRSDVKCHLKETERADGALDAV